MSERGREFVERWVDASIFTDAQREVEDDDPEAEVFADQCLAAAADQGISRDEIEDEVGYLVRYMVNAMREKAEADRRRLRGRDD